MSEKEAGSVLTSENAAEFYANRLGLAESPAEPVAEESEPVAVETQSEPEEAETAKPQEERKQNPKLEKRFSEITKQREEARAEAQRERDARLALEARIAALEKPQPQQAAVEEEPQPHQFSDAFEYAKALTDYRVEARLAQEKAAQVEARAQVERQKVYDDWSKRVVAAKAELPDFDDMVQSASDVVIPDHIRDAILESDVGPRVLYHFAENPDVVKSLSAMTPIRALREVGKLEAKFEAKAEKPTVARSKAPEPIQPIRANGKADVPITANGEFHGSYQAWKEARRAGKIR
jgi:hypothetical protein